MSGTCTHLWEDVEVHPMDDVQPADYRLVQRCWKGDCRMMRELEVVT